MYNLANGMLSFLKEVNATVRSVLNEVPDWHLFVYQGQYSIHDGGNDLYDIGNKVRAFTFTNCVCHNLTNHRNAKEVRSTNAKMEYCVVFYAFNVRML